MIFEFQNGAGDIIEKSFPIGKCPKKIKKNKIEYSRLYSCPFVIMDWKTPKTIDSLARQNTEKMEKEGQIPKKQEKKNPWWRPNKKKLNSNLGKMSPAQIRKYIETGK